MPVEVSVAVVVLEVAAPPPGLAEELGGGEGDVDVLGGGLGVFVDVVGGVLVLGGVVLGVVVFGVVVLGVVGFAPVPRFLVEVPAPPLTTCRTTPGRLEGEPDAGASVGRTLSSVGITVEGVGDWLVAESAAVLVAARRIGLLMPLAIA